MIYIIIDCSYECDSLESIRKVIYASTDKEDAEQTFTKHCDGFDRDDNWCYAYDLYECSDGFNAFISFDGMKRIRHFESALENTLPLYSIGQKVLVEDYDVEWTIQKIRVNQLGKYEYYCYHSICNADWREESELSLSK